MDKALTDKIEAFLKENLDPEYGYILVIGRAGTTDSNIISNYPGKKVVEILKHFSEMAYVTFHKGEGNGHNPSKPSNN